MRAPSSLRSLPCLGLAALALLLGACSSAGPAADRSPGRARAALRTPTDPVALALTLRGAPYRYAGQSPSGFDCSGLVRYVHDHFGRSLPRTTAALAETGDWIPLDEVARGDLIFFGDPATRSVDHVGLVVSADPLTMVHAATSTGVVVTAVTDSRYWLGRLVFARRP